jgi:hypothetical protein
MPPAGQASRICYFIFDLLVCENHVLTRLPFIQRREIMNSAVKFRSSRIRIAEYFETSGEEMLRAVRKQGLEGQNEYLTIFARLDTGICTSQFGRSFLKCLRSIAVT